MGPLKVTPQNIFHGLKLKCNRRSSTNHWFQHNAHKTSKRLKKSENWTQLVTGGPNHVISNHIYTFLLKIVVRQGSFNL